jgi:hypothetical protein
MSQMCQIRTSGGVDFQCELPTGRAEVSRLAMAAGADGGRAFRNSIEIDLLARPVRAPERRTTRRNPADHDGGTDHVGGALLAFRASGHVYLPSAIAL